MGTEFTSGPIGERNGVPGRCAASTGAAQAHAPNEITFKQDLVTCAAVYAALPGCYCK